MFDVNDLVPKAIVIAILLLFAFPVHEFAHAWVAYLQGDATAKLFGRMTLNPVVHFDRFGSLMTVVSVALGGFVIGWAKPTPVNTANLRDRRNGELIVALAGPASNWIMAIGGAIVGRVVLALQLDLPLIVGQVIVYFVFYNVVLGVFNLLPIPPLDGSTILFRFLSPRQAWQLRPVLSQYGIFVLLGILILAGPVLGSLMFDVTRFLLAG